MPLLNDIRNTPLLWLLVLVPVVLVAQALKPEAHTLLFVLSVLAIVPLAALLSRATEAVASRTGDTIGGLLNATLGNLTELLIALAALRAGQYVLVKASIAGAIVTNTLFMLGVVVPARRAEAPCAGVQPQQRAAAGRPAVPRDDRDPRSVGRRRAGRRRGRREVHAYAEREPRGGADRHLCAGAAVLAEDPSRILRRREHADEHEEEWPMSLALATLAGVTVLVALVSEIFVESVQQAATSLGLSPAFVGFIIVALVGGAAEMVAAFSAARKNRLDLSVGIALGSASQIALFVAPVLVLLSYVLGPSPMDLTFWPGAVAMILIAMMTASLVTNAGRSAWFVGWLVTVVYLIFALTLYLLPPKVS